VSKTLTLLQLYTEKNNIQPTDKAVIGEQPICHDMPCDDCKCIKECDELEISGSGEISLMLDDLEVEELKTTNPEYFV